MRATRLFSLFLTVPQPSTSALNDTVFYFYILTDSLGVYDMDENKVRIRQKSHEHE